MKRLGLLLAVLALAGSTGVLAGCSGGESDESDSSANAPAVGASGQPVPAENNPPGDIPDNIAFVDYTNPAGRYTFKHPEGWAETTNASTVNFTDKLNGVTAMTGPATTPPTVQSAQSQDIPALKTSQEAFELRTVTAVKVAAGQGVRIVYRRNSAADSVTGKQYRDEVERYEIVANGREVIVELYGPVGADNVDAYQTMISSLRLT